MIWDYQFEILRFEIMKIYRIEYVCNKYIFTG